MRISANLALVINRTPKVMAFAVDLHEHLVKMPAPLAGTHAGDPTFSDLTGTHRSEPVPPEPHRLVADVDPAFMQRILDAAQRERETDIQLHRKSDNLGAGSKSAERP